VSDNAPAPGATLEAADGDAADHAVAEGAETPDKSGSDSTLREMLLATDPDRSLDEIDAPYDPDRGGLARIYRGFMKMLNMSGTPAVIDLVVGAVEVIARIDTEDDTDDGELGGGRRRGE
jgi:hypothetical protein